jgi:hypothetical protein
MSQQKKKECSVTEKNGSHSDDTTSNSNSNSKSQLITTDVLSIDEKIESVLRGRSGIHHQFKTRVHTHETIAGVCLHLPHVIVNEIVDYSIGIYPEQLICSALNDNKLIITKNPLIVDSPIEYTKDMMVQVKISEPAQANTSSVDLNVPKTDFAFGWTINCSHPFCFILKYENQRKNCYSGWYTNPRSVNLQIESSSVQPIDNSDVRPVSITISWMMDYCSNNDFKLLITPFA